MKGFKKKRKKGEHFFSKKKEKEKRKESKERKERKGKNQKKSRRTRNFEKKKEEKIKEVKHVEKSQICQKVKKRQKQKKARNVLKKWKGTMFLIFKFLKWNQNGTKKDQKERVKKKTQKGDRNRFFVLIWKQKRKGSKNKSEKK